MSSTKTTEDIIQYENPYYKVVTRNGYFIIDEGNDVAGALVIAETKDGRFVLVKQFRVPIDQTTYEYPRGGRSGPDETLDQAAMRELREETGYGVESLEFLGLIHPNSAILRTGVAVYYAKLKDVPEFERDHEVDEVIYVSRRQMAEMIRNNEITDAMTLSAFVMAFTKQALDRM